MDSIETTIELLFDGDALKYFKNKTIGGTNNQKGERYENFFAVFLLSDYFQICINQKDNVEDDFCLHSQYSAFVDDLVVINKQHHSQIHYQLKNTKSINWGTSVKSIQDDFIKQYQINTALDVNYTQLFLVVSDLEKANNLQQNLPLAISNFSRVQFFMGTETLNQLLMSSVQFRKNLSNLCASSDLDKLEALATIILGVWVAKCKTLNSIVELLQQVENTRPNFLVQKIEGFVWLIQAQELLQAIPNFVFSIEKGYLSWNYNNSLESGMLDYSIDTEDFIYFQRILISKHPQRFAELEEILL